MYSADKIVLVMTALESVKVSFLVFSKYSPEALNYANKPASENCTLSRRNLPYGRKLVGTQAQRYTRNMHNFRLQLAYCVYS